MVAGRAWGAAVTRKTWEGGGGSSRLLRSAFAACSVMRWASSITTTPAPASKGRSAIARTAAPPSSILIAAGFWPIPSGPAKGRAGGSRPWRSARDRSCLTWSWPMILAKATLPHRDEPPRLDRGPQAGAHLRRRSLAVHPHPSSGILGREGEIARPYALVEFPDLGLQAVVHAAFSPPGQARLP